MGVFNRGLSPSIENISPWHRSMARAYVSGMRPKDLVLHYGMTAAHISRILGSPAFLSEVRRLSEGADASATQLAEDLLAMRETALENIDADLNMDPGSDPKLIALRQKASFGILEFSLERKDGLVPREGMGDVTINQQINIAGMSKEDLSNEVFDLIKTG